MDAQSTLSASSEKELTVTDFVPDDISEIPKLFQFPIELPLKLKNTHSPKSKTAR
ncbi:hypothetical protein SEQ01_07660 [Streptococcus equinus]|nr:hypothetical protein SEQ01_07660 [Streptococcus equinus]